MAPYGDMTSGAAKDPLTSSAVGWRVDALYSALEQQNTVGFNERIQREG